MKKVKQFVKQTPSNDRFLNENELKSCSGQRSSGVEQRFRNSMIGIPIRGFSFEVGLLRQLNNSVLKLG